MDTTAAVVEILSDALAVPVSTEMPREQRTPKAMLERYVLVDLSGDQSTPFLLMPRYTLTCWGSSDKDAHGIAMSAVDALREAAQDHPYLSACLLETMSREEWSRSGQARYYVEVDLTFNTD